MTPTVREFLKENNILLEKVPANLTYLFQPLDVQGGPNGYVKRYMKNKFTLWYADQVTHALEEGKDIKDVDISLKLSIVNVSISITKYSKSLCIIITELTIVNITVSP